MDSQEFVRHLNKIQELMEQEDYQKAIDLIEKLKKVEKESEFGYNLTHSLYQLDSNTHSLYNQQIILENVKELTKKQKTISFQELNRFIRTKNELDLTDDILRREIELLILRDILRGKIEKDTIILNSS